MSEVPGVTVVLPSLDVNPMLVTAVQSVLDQSGVDVELVLVLDGSDDAVPEAWSQDRRVRIHRNPRRMGVGCSLNVGVGLASNEFVARLDADDYCLPGRLFRQVKALEAMPTVAVLGTCALRINTDGEQTGVLGRRLDAVQMKKTLRWRNPLIHSSVMMRRSVLLSVGGYDEQLRQMEDYELWLRIAALHDMEVLGDKLVAYRVHDGQMSKSVRPNGAYTKTVIDARRRLAPTPLAQLGQLGRDAAWLSAQALNSVPGGRMLPERVRALRR